MGEAAKAEPGSRGDGEELVRLVQGVDLFTPIYILGYHASHML